MTHQAHFATHSLIRPAQLVRRIRRTNKHALEKTRQIFADDNRMYIFFLRITLIRMRRFDTAHQPFCAVFVHRNICAHKVFDDWCQTVAGSLRGVDNFWGGSICM